MGCDLRCVSGIPIEMLSWHNPVLSNDFEFECLNEEIITWLKLELWGTKMESRYNKEWDLQKKINLNYFA